MCVFLYVLVHMCVCMAMGQREQLRKWEKKKLILDEEGIMWPLKAHNLMLVR